MRKFKRLTLTLALLLTAVTGAWATEPTVYESGQTVNQNDLKVGDIILGGVTINGTNDGGYIILKAGRFSRDGIIPDYNSEVNRYPITVNADGSWKHPNATMVFAPIDASGQAGNAWEVTAKTQVENDYDVSIVGIQYVADAIELTPDETGKTWTLAKMPASNIELQVEYEPTKVTMAANDNAMGTVEVSGESKVEWTADTWKGWTYNTKEYTVDDITMTSSNTAYIQEYTGEGMYKNSLDFFVDQTEDNSTVTFSTTGDPFSRIEFTMIADYAEDELFNNRWHGNPTIMPKDGWTFSGKSAKWEGEATKSLTLQSCTTNVSKITFFKGGDIPDGVTVNGDGTFTVAKTATVTLKATPAEGYKFLYWDDDHTNTNPVREVTIESGMADKTYQAVFAEITYNVTFVEGTNPDPENPEWTATPATEVKKDAKVDIKYTGAKKVIGVKVEKKKAEPVADIIWDGTNVTDLNVESTYVSYTKEGVKLSGNADEVQVKWNNSAYLGTPGMEFITMESGGFTFTAPTGKKFTKIEMKALGSSGWAQVNLGTGWAYNTGTVTWNGSAASTVKLLKDADMFSGDFISSIAFYLSE